jgi:hypothetical protein
VASYPRASSADEICAFAGAKEKTVSVEKKASLGVTPAMEAGIADDSGLSRKSSASCQ